MKKTIAALLVAMILLISTNSVLAYTGPCDICGSENGWYVCYRRYYDTYFCNETGCNGKFWWCYTDWRCENGHGTWLSGAHAHASYEHTCTMYTNIVGCPYQKHKLVPRCFRRLWGTSSHTVNAMVITSIPAMIFNALRKKKTAPVECNCSSLLEMPVTFIH